MTQKRRTLTEKAHMAMGVPHAKFIAETDGEETEFTNGYTWGFVDGYVIGWRAAQRERKRK
jgi:hypothetical protein